MEQVAIQKPTAHMKRKMIKGEPFRIKKGVNGEGVMLVHKEKMPKIHRAFSKGKAHTLMLSQEEVNANGEGIFGDKFDKALKKHGIKKLAYKLGDSVKPGVVRAVRYGLPAAVGSAAVAETLASFGLGGMGGAALTAASMPIANELANYIDNPRAYKDTPSRKENVVAINDLKSAGMYKLGELGTNPYAQINNYTGQQLGVLGQANGQQAIANSLNQQLSNAQGFSREALYTAPVFSGGLNAPSVLQSAQLENPLSINPLIGTPVAPTTAVASVKNRGHKSSGSGLGVGLSVSGNDMEGQGLHHIVKRNVMSHEMRGKGVRERHGKMVEMGSVGIHGNLLRTNQALVPAPYSQNFMWANTLPSAYKRFNSTPQAPTSMF